MLPAMSPDTLFSSEISPSDAVAVLGSAVAVLVAMSTLIAVVRRLLYVCRPNEILIFSGRKHVLADGTAVGYRVLHGGRMLRIPVLETVARMDMRLFPVE